VAPADACARARDRSPLTDGPVVTRFQHRSAGLTWRAVDDETIILDADKSIYLRLNASGQELWAMLGHACSADELADALAARYGVDRAAVRADVDAFLRSCRSSDLIEEIAP
jgi:hypothetical protein